MAEKKKNVYAADTLALPPLRLVLGDVPAPDPVKRRPATVPLHPNPELEAPVRKLIAHLKDEKK